MKSKILTSFLVILFSVVILNINQVLAVGVVSQCWKNDINGDGKADLLFRIFTTAHPSTVEGYYNKNKNSTDYVENSDGIIWEYIYNNEWYRSKWSDQQNDDEMDVPSTYTYSTLGFAFHTARMCEYNERVSGSTAYIGFNKIPNELSNDIITIKNALNNSESIEAVPNRINNYDDVVFFEKMIAGANYSNTNPYRIKS